MDDRQEDHPCVGAAEGDSSADTRLISLCIGAASVGGLLLLVFAILREPNSPGIIDWDYFFHVYEAVRVSVVRYGQFPWWNIWNCGGVPLFANPQVGVLSVNTLFVLLFGAVAGLKVSLAAHIIFGFEGMRRLLGRYVSAPFALLGAGVFTGCGGLALHCAVGHFSMVTIYYLPWLLHFVVGVPDADRYGWLLGLTMALMVLDAIHYNTVFVGLIVAVASLCVLVAGQGARRQIAGRLAISFGLFLLIAGFRLVLSTRYVSEYSLTAKVPEAALWGNNFAAFLLPVTDMVFRCPPANERFWWEYGCYLGPAVVALFCLSLFRGVRHWHVGALLCLLAAQSITGFWSPSCWLSRAPVFRAIRVVTRWRIPAAFFIAMGAAVGGDECWKRLGPKRSRLKPLLAGICLFAMLAVFAVSFQIMRQAFPGPSPSSVALRRQRPGRFFHVRRGLMYPATRMNVGIVRGYEPLLGYDRGRANAVQARGEPHYRGEATEDGKLRNPCYWSPNLIAYKNVKGALRVNLAPGSYWRVNGKDVFRGLRVTEPATPFVVRPNARGHVILAVVPSGWRQGVGLSLLGLVVLAAVKVGPLLAERRRLRRVSEKASDNTNEGT